MSARDLTDDEARAFAARWAWWTKHDGPINVEIVDGVPAVVLMKRGPQPLTADEREALFGLVRRWGEQEREAAECMVEDCEGGSVHDALAHMLSDVLGIDEAAAKDLGRLAGWP